MNDKFEQISKNSMLVLLYQKSFELVEPARTLFLLTLPLILWYKVLLRIFNGACDFIHLIVYSVWVLFSLRPWIVFFGSVLDIWSTVKSRDSFVGRWDWTLNSATNLVPRACDSLGRCSETRDWGECFESFDWFKLNNEETENEETENERLLLD